MRLWSSTIAALALILAGCGHGDGAPVSCDAGPRAAFEVRVSALAGALPGDAKLAVRYGGGTEEVALAAPPSSPRVVFCRLERADAGAPGDGGPGGDVHAAVCDLWTSGAAAVTVRATGYPELARELDAERDDCGIRTVPVELVLGSDAGG